MPSRRAPARTDPRKPAPSALLERAEALKLDFGPAAARRKLESLRPLERTELRNPREVTRLHELLCFWRAYPDDRRLLARVERMLRGFARRQDVARHARA